MRALVLSIVFFGACATAQADPVPAPAAAPAEQQMQRAPDPFVWAGDECGASRYAHLVGEEIAHLDQTALPESAVVHLNTLTTLEYRPGKLNVVVNASGRITAVGCF